MPSFQARHYVAVAKVLRKHWAEAEPLAKHGDTYDTRLVGRFTLDTLTRVSDDFMRMFAADNPSFDNVRFYDAVKTGKGL